MDEANIKVLNACCELIIRDMNVTSVVDYLIGTNPPVLLRYHANDIMKITDSEERNRKFLTILQQRGKFNAFVHFLEALKNTQQNELYTSILDRSKEPISAKNSDKNQDDKGIALGKLANLPPPGATKIDEALQR
uniref:CARD domain-containing protein n=1 Tax=Plectus sambesii TaxID=2011161 RepID=A0A914W6E3_9BILA